MRSRSIRPIWFAKWPSMPSGAIFPRKSCGWGATWSSSNRSWPVEESAGRKLEFLTQEMFREANTIGSKSNDVEIARHVIEIKAAIERIARNDPECGMRNSKATLPTPRRSNIVLPRCFVTIRNDSFPPRPCDRHLRAIGGGENDALAAAAVDAAIGWCRAFRPPRGRHGQGKSTGVDYHFLSREEFERRRQQGDFLECAEVFGRGDWYGTLVSEVAPRLAAGKWVVLEIDVQGTLAVVRQFPDAVTIFVRPESLEELERRLRSRGTESEEAIQRRLASGPQRVELCRHVSIPGYQRRPSTRPSTKF